MIKNSEITFNRPLNPSEKKPNGAPDKPDFKEISKKKKLDQLQQDQEKIKKRILTLKKTPFASTLRKIALNLKIAQNPNNDPQYLTHQVRPVLTSMGLQSIVQNNKTQLVIGKTRKNDSLYEVLMRREAVIDGDIIKRINRNVDSLERIEWSGEAIKIYLWAPYVAPAGAPEKPGI